MTILITGICGFVGSIIADALIASSDGFRVLGVDNLSRAGSELNRQRLRDIGVQLVVGDIRLQSDIDSLPEADWVVDCAANASVLSGISGDIRPRQLIENNLGGTINLLEYCRQRKTGFILLSTSRVYNIPKLTCLEYEVTNGALQPNPNQAFPEGISRNGVAESFSTDAPISLYGSTKLCSEQLALEYGAAFHFPVWINRCGVLAGAGQFARPDQGIIAFWIHSWCARAPLRYIGFGGQGHQVRDIMHPSDLIPVLLKQFDTTCESPLPRICNFGGGVPNSLSLSQLSQWCRTNLGEHAVMSNDLEDRPFDLPWFVMNHDLASSIWQWQPKRGVKEIMSEIATFAQRNPRWLSRTS